ncbi:juvenile hormone esterase-like [Anopheles darlingi]|uniref:juvenile hormone esterase-like n=1 Tax=Anopheles darlingi TaxID=43151 RepID=UPI0020FFFB95|nr:juvenile hormone esterase-like [Anopheles darlingi]
MANDRWSVVQCHHRSNITLFVFVLLALTVLVTLAVTLTTHHHGTATTVVQPLNDAPLLECIVTFDRGVGIGMRRQTFTDRRYCAYEGIPYVEPPVGARRFEDPQPYRFQGTRLYWNVSKACPQAYAAHIDPLATSEDCLYLNVYTGTGVAVREVDSNGTLWPVLLWVHGGSFVVGSSETDIFGPEFFIDKSIIVVTFNYRLGALGFLSLPDLGINANLGLLDQLEALRWVGRNIVSFGGDPNRVSLCGWSAGGASVSYHLYSRAAHGLFQRAIIMSGTMTQSWAYDYDPDRCGREFLRANDAVRVEQLRSDHHRTLDQLMTFGRSFHIDFFSLYYYCFLPTDDSQRATEATTVPSCTDRVRFVGQDPFATVRTVSPVSDVPLLVGYTELEHGNLYLERDFSVTTRTNFPNTNGTIFERLERYLERERWAWELGLNRNRSTGHHQQQPRRMTDSTFYRELAAVADIIYGIQYFIRYASNRMRSPVYRYLFAYDGAFGYAKHYYYRNQISRQPGPMHGDDLGYLFTPYLYRRPTPPANVEEAGGINGGHITTTQSGRYRTERRVQRRMVALWSNFIKYGNPTPEPHRKKPRAIRWQPYNDVSRGRHYLRIDQRLQLLPEADTENPFHIIWDRVFRCLYEFSCEFLNEYGETLDTTGGDGSSEETGYSGHGDDVRDDDE